MRHVRWVTVAGFLVALALVAAGCHRVTGGGWIVSKTGDGKATFGFSAKCVEDGFAGPGNAHFYEGKVQYNDNPAGVRFHADIDPFLARIAVTCEDVHGEPFGGPYQLTGTYRPQPKGASGNITVVIEDNGEPGGADTFAVSLTGGLHGGYTNSGTLGGGNIQIDND